MGNVDRTIIIRVYLSSSSNHHYRRYLLLEQHFFSLRNYKIIPDSLPPTRRPYDTHKEVVCTIFKLTRFIMIIFLFFLSYPLNIFFLSKSFVYYLLPVLEVDLIASDDIIIMMVIITFYTQNTHIYMSNVPSSFYRIY